MTDTERLDIDEIEAKYQWFVSDEETAEDLAALIAEVRRLREEAERGWEYGFFAENGRNWGFDWSTLSREEVLAECERRNFEDARRGYSMHSTAYRRRPAGEPEKLV